MKEIRIGVLGAGPFANNFLPLFKAHPIVKDVYLAERMKERREPTAEKFGLATTFDDYEDLLKSDVDAIGVFSQRWTHAAQAIKAMRAGKHVFSAVPAAISLEDLEELIATVKETGQLYMLGETSYYGGGNDLLSQAVPEGRIRTVCLRSIRLLSRHGARVLPTLPDGKWT